MKPTSAAVRAVVFLGVLKLAAGARAQSDLSLTGSIQVTLTPAAAAAAGAAWSVAGRQPRASGATETGLPPGRAAVQFERIPGWREPAAQEVVIVGGKLQAAAGEHTPLAEYYFLAIPDQTARHGETLRFLVRSSDPDDPTSPPNGAGLAMKVSPQPAGAVHFDSAGRELSYTPDLADRTDFLVIFTVSTAAGPREGTVLVSPLPALPPEDSAIRFQNDLVVPDSNDYVRVRQEVSETEEIFNQRKQKTRKASISGAWLVFEDQSLQMPLYDDLNGDVDIKELTLYADRITIKSPLHLPETTVRIFARELRFEGAGRLDVTQTTAPFPVHAGLDGVKGPDITVYVERFHSDPTAIKRFISRGMNGLEPVGGRDGGTGLRPGTETCGTSQGKTIVYEACNNTELGELEVFCGQPIVYGEDAVPFSKPGEGGDGGSIFSTLNLAPYADLPPGNAGPQGRTTIGGTPTNIVSKRWGGPPNNPCSSFAISNVTGLKGKNALSPPALRPTGSPGRIVLAPDPGVWLHPISVQSFLFYVKDLYLANDPDLVRKSLEDYEVRIRLLKANLPDGDEKSLFGHLSSEIAALLGRIANSLDYFGSPLTWVPMLSFEANLAAFTQEVDRAIPVLYFAYWIEAAANRAKSTRNAIVAGKLKLGEEIDAALDAYEEAQEEIPLLLVESAELEEKLAAVIGKLAQLEAELLRRAQENVKERHKVPFWRKALGALGAITKVIPWGQPALGFVGVGLGVISNTDSDHPLAGLGQVPDLLKAVRETNYTSCLEGKAKQTKEEKAAGKKADRLTRVGRLQACAQLALPAIKSLADIFKATAIKDEEVKAELEKIRASDPVFRALTEELKVLTAQKQVLVERIAATVQVISSTGGIVAEKLLAIQRLDQNLTGVLEVLDHQALLYVSNLGRETRDRLLKYQYFMAKAYQYRVLRPYTGSFKLAELFDELKRLTDFDNSTHDLSANDFETLKAIYIGELSRIKEEIVTDLNTNAPARSSPVSFRLSKEELSELNTTGKLTIDLGRRNLFGAGEQNLRIVSLATKRPVFKVNGQVTGTATLRLEFQHSGFSRIHEDGRHFLFTHYRTERVNPITWSTVYSALTGETTETTVSAADESLLRALLGGEGADSDRVLLFSRPGALTEIHITKEVTADNGVTIDVEDLILELVYDFSKRGAIFHDLRIETNDGLLPLITASEADLEGRGDGRGRFTRSFQGSRGLRLRAPERYGVWKFDRWEEMGGGGLDGILGRDPVLDVTVASDVALRAVYVSDVEPPPGGFRRGDANGDLAVDISDAVTTLGYLFTGGVEPPCLDAADANDDGALDISDAVTSLGYLFTGGVAPPTPGPEACGPDPTADPLGACAAGACE